MDNTSSNGDLNNIKAAPASLQYHDTLIAEIRLSPAQILFHRQLLDDLPTNPVRCHFHSDWLISTTKREKQFIQHTQKIINAYKNQPYILNPLPMQSHVLIQNLHKKKNLKWTQTAAIVEILPFQQYKV